MLSLARSDPFGVTVSPPAAHPSSRTGLADGGTRRFAQTPPYSEPVANDARRIVVTGTGVEMGTPDRCEVHFTLNVLADTPGVALDQVSALAGQVITALRDDGIDGPNIQTAQVSVQDRYDSRLPQLKTFVVGVVLS